MLNPMQLLRTRLALRLTLILIAIALVPMALVSTLSYQRAHQALNDSALQSVTRDIDWITRDTATFLGHFSSDILALSKTPPVQGIIRARDNAGMDEAHNSTYQDWVNRLTQIFIGTMQDKSFYMQLRYLDENGNELVRVDQRDGEIKALADEQLQNKRRSAYFTESRHLRQGEIYISPLNLNREHGRVEVPHVPVIRFSTPVYDSGGKFRGILVSNYYAKELVPRLAVKQGQIYLTNPEGFYLYHPQAERRFGFDLGHNHTAHVDFPALYPKFQNAEQESMIAMDKARGQVVAMKNLYFDPLHPKRHWTFVRTLPESVFLEEIRGLDKQLWLIAIIAGIAIVFLAHWLAVGFSRPIRELQSLVRQISETELPAVAQVMERMAEGKFDAELKLDAKKTYLTSQDEVGKLQESFNEMLDSLQHTGSAFKQMQVNLNRVIGDIVQVSQGLAEGNLEVRPRSDYPGDLKRIRVALETALNNQHTVVEDIVEVSEGLAGERMDIRPKADYLGSFVRIKQSLETTAVKLNQAALSSKRQDWIKSGQTGLSAQISGEQELLELAGKIIQFISTYLEAQTGVFYVMEHDNGGKPRLRLIAAYAYTIRDGISNTPALGQGPAGQAALEKQPVVVSRPPENTPAVRSGLGESAPKNVLAIPFLYENEVKGVIELGALTPFNEAHLELLQQLMPAVAIAINTARSHEQMQQWNKNTLQAQE